MSLDQNLFTLILTPNKDDPNVIDLVDPDGSIHYRKQRMPGSTYSINVYDYMSQSLLITASGPATTSKVKIMELCNPTTTVELKYTGTLSFRWHFRWEEHDFEWKREECYLIRKPDPPVLVAITKEPPGRLKTTSVQILDYNLHRFDIEDRKGLEIVMLTALLTFQDSNEEYHNSTSGTGMLGALRRTSAIATPAVSPRSSNINVTATPPIPPPRPTPKMGVDKIAETHAIRGDVNEITVDEDGSVADYAQYCANLLQDDAMLFVTVKSESESQVPRVIQIVEETKRIMHRAGVFEDSELHQYVLYDTIKPKGPRIIKLDDDSQSKYRPPNSLIIHLSKIPMPELQPKPTNKIASEPSMASQSEMTARKEDRKADKKGKGSSPSGTSKPIKPNRKLFRKARSISPPASSTPVSSRSAPVPSHEMHPVQPSPPVQLNNPTTYAATPPTYRDHHYTGSVDCSSPPSFPMPTVVSSVLPPRPNSTEPSLYGSHAPPLYSPQSEPRSSQRNTEFWDSVSFNRRN